MKEIALRVSIIIAINEINANKKCTKIDFARIAHSHPNSIESGQLKCVHFEPIRKLKKKTNGIATSQTMIDSRHVQQRTLHTYGIHRGSLSQSFETATYEGLRQGASLNVMRRHQCVNGRSLHMDRNGIDKELRFPRTWTTTQKPGRTYRSVELLWQDSNMDKWWMSIYWCETYAMLSCYSFRYSLIHTDTNAHTLAPPEISRRLSNSNKKQQRIIGILSLLNCWVSARARVCMSSCE